MELKPELTTTAWSVGISEAHAQQAGMPRTALNEFYKCYQRRVDDRYRRRLTDSQMLDRMISMAQFCAQRKSDDIKVRVYAPHELGLDPSENVVVLETCMTDQPFIVDTLRLCVTELGLQEVASVHVLYHVQRDAEGRATTLLNTQSPGFLVESATHIVLHGARDPAVRDRLYGEVCIRLSIARTAVGDYLRYQRMVKDFMNDYDFLAAQAASHEGPTQEDLREANPLLHWLLDDHFLFMASLSFRAKGGTLECVPSECLGTWAVAPDDTAVQSATRFFTEDPGGAQVVRIQRTDRNSRMHRKGKLDALLLRRFDDARKPDGGVLIFGIFTRLAYSTHLSTVPFLRRRLGTMLEIDEIRPASHLYKTTTNAFNELPINYLFEAPDAELQALVHITREFENSGETVAFIDIDPSHRTTWAFAIILKEDFSENILEGVRALLVRELEAADCDHLVKMGLGNTAIMHYYLSGCGVSDEALEKRLKESIAELCTPWRVRFHRALKKKFEVDAAKRFYGVYTEAFPEKYQSAVTPEQAVFDVEHLDALTASGQIQFDIVPGMVDRDEVHIRLYRTSSLFLSDILPILDHFGFRVLDQDPIQVDLADRTRLLIDTFRLQADRKSGETDYVQNKERLVQGLRAVFEKRMVSDPLNRLMLRPGLTWDDVDVLRAYLGYSMQIGPFFAADVVQRVVYAHPQLTGALIDYFHARFNPHFGGAADPARKARMDTSRKGVTDMLTKITDATEDRVFRILLNLIDATIRTNLFRGDRKGHYISFKIECARLEKCPEPRPLFEIYVHHAEMEGCHLRGGRVARGGIRWSDRLEDYRTEIFGLMRTQMVKNVLIVPVGAKGGFVVKGKPKLGQDRKAYGDAMYEVLIRGLLDVTDNRVDGQPARPKQVVCHDDYDPYMVVAADKGTAHLSDTANRLSAEYRHWLGDAFASGGSQGYDHKVEGITARGAWACIRHLFEGMGIDPNRDAIRVVGIGDMAGDVFGNGLLRSRTLELVGAFNHMHVFLDPDPDPEVSFKERERMFKLSRSTWADYRKETLSKGGGIWSRTEKSIPLGPELQQLLHTERKEMGGDEVIRTLLTLDVDLLYNGGIGTYVKSSEEDHREVGDKANDAVRVNGSDVRARVIGEGGNLGMTQMARIEYCRRGGRCHTDAIDNSGGVDLSDHEVNLKILFEPEVSGKRMTLEERNKVLRAIGPEVDEKVVADNDAHALMLTLDEIRSQRDPHSFVQAIEFLAERGIMDPRIEKLQHAIDGQGAAQKIGLTRPELSKLDAFAKMFIYNELVKVDALRIPRREHLLSDYIPRAVYDKYKEAISRHMLLREILATVWTNHMSTYVGGVFFPEMLWDTERSVQDVAFAYTAIDGWLDAFSLRRKLLGMKEVPATARYEGLVALESGLREAASWLLHFLPGEQLFQRIGDGQDLYKAGEPYRAAWRSVVGALPTAASSAQRRVDHDLEKLVKASLPTEVAREVALACQWAKVFPVCELARKTGRPTPEVAATYLSCGQQTGLNGLVLRIARQPSTDRWEAQALRSLRQGLLRTLYSLAEKSLEVGVDEVMRREPAFLAIGNDIARMQQQAAPVTISLLVVMSERLHKALVRL